MKVDYIVWLKSGECISGTAEEKAIDALNDGWVNEKFDFFCLTDDDGTVYIKLSEVEAVAKNHTENMAECGF